MLSSKKIFKKTKQKRARSEVIKFLETLLKPHIEVETNLRSNKKCRSKLGITLIKWKDYIDVLLKVVTADGKTELR